MSDLSINIDGLEVTTANDKKKILTKMDIPIKKGRVVAIIGPSGSGKTTLLNTISGKIQSGVTYKGSVNINGKMKVVPQEEHLNGFYTTRGYIDHYMNLNYGFMDNSLKTNIVEKMLQETGLASCHDTKVGDVFIKGLSGGQKRRLSIALELIGSPNVLVLDEPTTGLDSVSAYHVMKILHEFAKNGNTVVCSIHQPSSDIWEMLDQIIFLSGGFLCYNGSTIGATRFFAEQGKVVPMHYNPADYFLLQINNDFNPLIDPREINSRYLYWVGSEREHHILNYDEIEGKTFINMDLAAQTIPEDGSLISANKMIETIPTKGNFLTKLIFMTQRYLINTVLNPGIIFVRLAMYIILCFCIGFMYFHLEKDLDDASIISRTSVLFYVDAFLVFMSVAVLPFFMIERGIFEKENANRLIRPVHYQLAMFISSIPAVALISIVSTILVNLIAQLNGFGVFFTVLFLSLMCGEALAMLISLFVPHFIIGIAVIAGLYGIFMLMQGFLIVKSNIPGYFIWIYYIAFHTYSFQGLMVNEFAPIQAFNSIKFADGNAVLQFYGMESASIWRSCVILTGFALGFQLIVFFLMLWIYRRRSIN